VAIVFPLVTCTFCGASGTVTTGTDKAGLIRKTNADATANVVDFRTRVPRIFSHIQVSRIGYLQLTTNR